jgi:TonB-dependent Receptor Plug Domain/CarboxypepD_reg-like domain
MKIKITLLLSILLYVLNSNAQSNLTINGYIQDAKTGEKLVGLSVWSPLQKVGTNTNNYGYFTLTFKKDTASVLFSATGYQPQLIFFDKTNSDSILIITMEKMVLNKDAVVVRARRNIPIQERTLMGQISVPIELIKAMPKFLGEVDVLKTLQLLPGVSQGAEGTSGILVRGGGPDQNLILLDGSPVYNSQHLFGIFSSFNADAIKNVELYKGGFPARFGGRLSSVVDIVTKDGDLSGVHGEIGTGLLMTRVLIEGPIKKDKTSFVISGRRSYADVLAQPFIKKAAKNDGTNLGFSAFFYDLNLKVTHKISNKDRLYFSFYSGQDFLKLKVGEKFNNTESTQKLRVGYGNLIGSVRWNHVFNSKLFANSLVSYTKYRFTTGIELSDKDATGTTSFAAKYFSGITDVAGNINFDYRPNAQHSIKFGGGVINHQFTPGAASVKSVDANIPTIDTSFNTLSQNSFEGNVYFEDDWTISDKFKANLGVHASFFQAKNKFYPSIQPRIGLRYLLPKDWAIKAGYTHMAQFIHLLTNSTTTLPTDLWVPSTDLIKPMLSQQVALGLAKSIWGEEYEASVEAYYKTMDGVIEYKDGASYLNGSNDNWDTKVEQGSGISKGVEVFLQKKRGNTLGWIGYTLSKSDRVFDGINYGKRFNYKYDRRHDFEVAITHKINKNWEISGSWGFSTASAISLPVANYQLANTNGTPYTNTYYYGTSSVDYYNGRNGFRLLNYHRLDFSVNWTKQKKKYTRTWNLSLYNAYNRKNPFYYYPSYNNITQQGEIKAISLLPIIPNISWTIKF